MATDNRGVMVYLPSEVEAKIIEYCQESKITRKDKHGNILPSLGSGIVAYLKSQLLSDLPSTILSDRASNGLTRDEVLDLIAESSTSNILKNDISEKMDGDFVIRLENIERSLSSLAGIARDEVEQLIRASGQQTMAAVGEMLAELRRELKEVAASDDLATILPISSFTSKKKAIEKNVKSPPTATKSASVISGDRSITKDISRWLKPLQEDNKFREIIQIGISEQLTNKEIITKLFDAGYGKDNNTMPYPTNLASAMKTAYLMVKDDSAIESQISTT